MNHRCKSKFYALLGNDNEDEDKCPEAEEMPKEDTEEAVLGDVSSLNTLTGLGKSRSLQLIGTVGKKEFKMLIDSGSTHNFV